MKGQFSKQEIASLLNKFMAGETSLEEENILAQYFRTHEVSEEWKEYKEMFAMFDSGTVDVSLNSLPLTPSEGRGTQSRFSSLSLWRGRLGSLEEPLNVALAPQRGANPHSRRRSGVRLVGLIAASIVIAFILWPDNPVEEQPVIAEVVEQPVQEVPKVSENFEVSENSDKSESLEPIKPKRTDKPLPKEEPLLAQTDEEPVISADKQALVDIYLAEEALQVAYELQAQQEELRAYAASLMGVEEPQPQSIIAF